MSSREMDSLEGKRLVIFGCGYLGAAVALEARARGLRVTALTRNAASAIVLREQGIEAVVADLASDAWHPHIAPAPELTLNCVSSGGGGSESYRHSYVDGMKSILGWAAASGRIGTLVYTSSTSVYPQSGGAQVDENAATGGTERAAILLEAEAELRENAAACGRWFILRLAGIYGPGRHHFVDQVRAGEVSGKAEHHLNLIHRDDAVAAIWACLAAPVQVQNQVFNVVDEQPTRRTEIGAWLARNLGVPLPRFTGEPASSRRSLTPDRIIRGDKLKTQLDWRPRYPSFREGCANFLSR